ncbi:MAG: methyltransferase domain-containing protein [Methylobacterium sp.]|uniref:class I SAM-dependent DNA methyltransferase n=1 Tax=Methylobacterium sp. TaxID=409 RepID=UPI0025EFF5D6|nr:methyltransferase domain-containing protein [Methylobacterium sp.]MBX9930466.1 methyltransferase domain-containing protein [Methylobacterium sp.]
MALQQSSGDILADRRYEYAQSCLAEGNALAAAEMAEQALDLAPRYAPAWFLLGRAREARHRKGGLPADHDAAIRAYATALELDPEDGLGARLHLTRLGEGVMLEAMSPAYVRALFDGYAPRFERHLVGDLAYRGPAIVIDALDRVAGAAARFATVFDLGCGTGLMGEALTGRSQNLVGVDLSPAMLVRAEKSGHYRRLVAGDLRTFLIAEPEGIADLVVAADVFIYLGDLVPIFAAIATTLKPEGFCAFTVQSHEGDDVVLGEDGRYAHGDAFLRQAATACGLAVRLFEEAAVRRERGAAVPGRVVVLERS